MNRKGFTLIELLAVITILGILMLIAIPAISRVIENTRRDAFANLAQSYIDAVKTAVVTENIRCKRNYETTFLSATEIPIGHHCYFNIQTEEGLPWTQQTKDMMEQGGKSPWGKLNVVGTVRFYKQKDPSSVDDKIEYHYEIRLKDTANHGTRTFVEDHNIMRKDIVTSGASGGISSGDAPNPSQAPYICYLS